MNNLANFITIIFVHSGKVKPPACMAQSLAIAYRVAPLSKIIALISRDHCDYLFNEIIENLPNKAIDKKRLEFIFIEDLNSDNLSNKFRENSKANREFRGGFWLETANRFMLIADLMEQFNLENCLHLENDNILYFDPTKYLEKFRSHARFAVPFDRSRAIPGIVWYQDTIIAKDLALYIQERSGMPDFDVLRQFCDSGMFDAKPLPTMSTVYAKTKNLSENNYSFGYEKFGGIFDAAAIGQYIGGVDPRNIPGDSRFFENETSDLNVAECELAWKYGDKFRYPTLKMRGEYIPIYSLHAHSKNSLGLSPYNYLSTDNEDQLITGERIQECAELTITSQETTAFHGIENIRTNNILEIPKKQIHKFFRKKIIDDAPAEDWIDTCQSTKTFFIYTHLVPYFKKYVAARLSSPFILISHNSDDGIKSDDLDLLNHPFLIKWFAQNCEFSHEKLSALPIGITNRQWGKEKYSLIVEASRDYQKKQMLYANFSIDTHASRQILLNIISSMKNVTKSHKLTYENYLKELAQHKFCLCPRGNGIDTHRFWESQCLNTIPVIIKSDWTQAYSGLPILVLNSWEELPFINFSLEYLKISSTYFDRSRVHILKYINNIKNSYLD